MEIDYHGNICFMKKTANIIGAIAPSSLDFLTEVGWRLSATTGERTRQHSCFSASLSLFNGSMRYSYISLLMSPTSSRTSSHSNMCFLASAFSPMAFYTIGQKNNTVVAMQNMTHKMS